MVTKKNSLDQVSRLALENFDKIADSLEIKYEEYGNRITMACPVHGGDNDGACVIFKDGQSICGNWSCFTHGCQEQYGISIIGFLRGAIETKTGEEQSYKDIIAFIEKAASNKISSVGVLPETNSDFRTFASYYVERVEAKPISKAVLVKNLKIPSQYYIRRGYGRDILNKYSVGFCNTKGKPFYLRTVVPVFNEEINSAVGVIGRTINSECPKCGWYHYVHHKCPETKLEKYFASKWINSKGFYKTNYLYNTWYAKPYIEDSKTAILVEGVGDVWRLEECGIHNSLSMFGCSLNDKQVDILKSMGVNKLVVALDNDDAGLEGKKKIRAKYGRYFSLEFITTTNKDIGDSSCSEILELFAKELVCQTC